MNNQFKHRRLPLAKRLSAFEWRLLVIVAVVLSLGLPAMAKANPEDVRRLYAFGNARALGAPQSTNRPLAAIEIAPSGNGYWIASEDGGVFAYGGAPFFGSLARISLNAPIVDITATPSGRGYWLVAEDGGVFAFGDAEFFGSAENVVLNETITALAPHSQGSGYWLFAKDGGVFAFGDAPFLGASTDVPHGDIVGGYSTRTGSGYALASSDGGVFSFGDALFRGSIPRDPGESPIVSIHGARYGNGYWLASEDGGVFAFGSAPFIGSTPGLDPEHPAIDIVAPGNDSGYLVLIGDKPDVPEDIGDLLGSFSTTCYALRGRTASGAYVSEDVVAVDPRVIPLGTRIYIEGVGFRTALDTGGAIKGNRLDIWRPTNAECFAWGRRSVQVYLS